MEGAVQQFQPLPKCPTDFWHSHNSIMSEKENTMSALERQRANILKQRQRRTEGANTMMQSDSPKRISVRPASAKRAGSIISMASLNDESPTDSVLDSSFSSRGGGDTAFPDVETITLG